MARYRKKPVVIEAEQWFIGQDPETYPECLYWDAEKGKYVLDTLEGCRLEASDGDYIITGIDGERYPCKPSIFERSYEPVDEL